LATRKISAQMSPIFAHSLGQADAIATYRGNAHAGIGVQAFDVAAQRTGAARFVRFQNRLTASFLDRSI